MSVVEGIFFDRKQNGTGTSLDSPILQLGQLPGLFLAQLAIPEYRCTQIDGLMRWTIDVYYVPQNVLNADIVTIRDNINAYIKTQLNAWNYKPVEIVTQPNGTVYVRTRGQQRGDLIAVASSGLPRILDANVALSEIEIIEDEMMPHGGMKLRYTFLKEAPNTSPPQRWVAFQIREGGTGSNVGSQINLTDDGTQSSRMTTFDRQTDGITQRLTVRTWYASEFGSRTLASILAYVDAQKTAMGWAPPVLKTTPQGLGRYLNIHNNFGDVYLTSTHDGSSSQTLIQNVTLEDARIVNTDEQGGIQVEYSFVNVRPEYMPDAKFLRFRMRQNGTGSGIAVANLTIDDPEASWLWDLQYTNQGNITTARVRVWMPNDHGATSLLNVQAKAVGLQNAMNYHPPIIKEMPRGKTIMPNIHNNFGDLMLHTSYVTSTSSTSGDVILDNCTLIEPAKVFESLNDGGVGMEFVFGRVANVNAV